MPKLVTQNIKISIFLIKTFVCGIHNYIKFTRLTYVDFIKVQTHPKVSSNLDAKTKQTKEHLNCSKPRVVYSKKPNVR